MPRLQSRHAWHCSRAGSPKRGCRRGSTTAVDTTNSGTSDCTSAVPQGIVWFSWVGALHSRDVAPDTVSVCICMWGGGGLSAACALCARVLRVLLASIEGTLTQKSMIFHETRRLDQDNDFPSLIEAPTKHHTATRYTSKNSGRGLSACCCPRLRHAWPSPVLRWFLAVLWAFQCDIVPKTHTAAQTEP